MVKKAEPEQTNNPSAQRSVETSGIRASIILEALCPLKNNVFAMGVGIPDQAEDIQVYFEDEKLSKYLTVGDLVEDLSGQEIAADTVVLVHSPAGAGDASEAIGQFIGKSIQKIAESDMISFGTETRVSYVLTRYFGNLVRSEFGSYGINARAFLKGLASVMCEYWMGYSIEKDRTRIFSEEIFYQRADLLAYLGELEKGFDDIRKADTSWMYHSKTLIHKDFDGWATSLLNLVANDIIESHSSLRFSHS